MYMEINLNDIRSENGLLNMHQKHRQPQKKLYLMKSKIFFFRGHYQDIEKINHKMKKYL